MSKNIKKEFQLTEVQLAKLPQGKKLRFHLTKVKRDNGDVYVISNATYTGKDDKGITRTKFVGSRLLGHFANGDESVLIPNRPRNWKQLELARQKDREAAAALEKAKNPPTSISVHEIKLAEGVMKFITEFTAKYEDENEPLAVVRVRREFIMLVAILSGMHGGCDAVSIADYWNRHKGELKLRITDFPDVTISADTVWKVLCTTPESVNSALLRTMYSSMVDLSLHRYIGLDGQAVKASRNEETGRCYQIAGVYDASSKQWIDHVRIEAKTNEIPTFPKLVKTLDLHGCTVTADALNTVVPLAEAILASGGHYCLAVKDNKGGLADALKDHFNSRLWMARDAKTVFDTPKVSHGRLDYRDYFFLPSYRLVGFEDEWPECSVGTIAMVKHYSVEKRQRWSKLDNKTVQAEKANAESEEIRFYISSHRFDDEKTPELLATAIRKHWGIEAAHYILDVDFGQDWQQCKQPTYLMATATIRKIATNLLQKILENGGTKLNEDSLRRLARNLDRPSEALRHIAAACHQLAVDYEKNKGS